MQETNTYAAKTSAPSGWYDTSVEDTKAFIGIMDIQNFIPLQCIGLLITLNYRPPSPIDLYL